MFSRLQCSRSIRDFLFNIVYPHLGQIRPLIASWVLVTIFRPSNVASEEINQNENSDCWTYGGADTLSGGLISPQVCCQNGPCGVQDCWQPPEMTYDFCCGVPACRPLAIGEIQRALLMISRQPWLKNATSVSRRAHTLVGPYLRDLHSRFRGLKLKRRAYEFLAITCDCAFALAAAAMVMPDSVDEDAITTSWLLDEIQWTHLLARGWGPLFFVLAKHASTMSTSSDSHASLSKHVAGVKELAQMEHLAIQEFMSIAQNSVRSIAFDIDAYDRGLNYLLSTIQSLGMLDVIWKRIDADITDRMAGKRCAAVSKKSPRGAVLEWTNCQAWSYSPAANFSSPRPNNMRAIGPRHVIRSSNLVWPTVAACVLGAPRTVIETYRGIRAFVVAPLKADVFVYVPFSGILNHELEEKLKYLGPLVTAIVAPDVDASGMRQRYNNEVRDADVDTVYKTISGPFKSPVHGEMGSVMWSYFSQSVCRRMVEAHERQRGGKRYGWIIFARADMYWTQPHPPIEVLDNAFVHVPFGQDNSFYNYGSEPGLNDRHAAIPRHLADDYLGRWEYFTSGRSWAYLQRAALKGELINAEQFLLMHLRALNVPVARFPPVSYLAMCVESPQCLHLFKGTTIGKRQWTFSAKYFPELVETIRTTQHSLHQKIRGWIWAPVTLYSLGNTVNEPWHLHSLEYTCCLGPSGPVSCKRWDMLKQCRCIK